MKQEIKNWFELIKILASQASYGLSKTEIRKCRNCSSEFCSGLYYLSVRKTKKLHCTVSMKKMIRFE